MMLLVGLVAGFVLFLVMSAPRSTKPHKLPQYMDAADMREKRG